MFKKINVMSLCVRVCARVCVCNIGVKSKTENESIIFTYFRQCCNVDAKYNPEP